MTEITNSLTEDSLVHDLLSILVDAALTADQQIAVMLKLAPYMVERDHRVYLYAYRAGRDDT